MISATAIVHEHQSAASPQTINIIAPSRCMCSTFRVYRITIMPDTTDTALPKLAYAVRDCGAALSIPQEHIRKAVRRGELTPRQLLGGNRSTIPADELLAWFKNQPPTPPRVPRNPYGRKGIPK